MASLMKPSGVFGQQQPRCLQLTNGPFDFLHIRFMAAVTLFQ